MQQLLLKAKRLFRRMTVREKLLSLLFILVILFIWTGNLITRNSTWNSNRQQTQAALNIQQEWLDRSDEFSIGLERALERVDPLKTYNGPQLSGRIDDILRKASLSADIDPVQTREREIFNDHTIRIRLSKISYEQLVHVNHLLSQETPYINLQSVQVSKGRNPEQLDVRFKINSFDLKKDQ